MNIKDLCEFLPVLVGDGYVGEKIPEQASVISIAVLTGSIEINYEHKYDGEHYSYVTARYPCAKAHNTYFIRLEAIKKEYAHIQDGPVKEEPLPKKDVKKFFRKKVK